MIDRIVNFMRSWLRLIRSTEAVFIDTIAATAPWLAPMIPAWMTWYSMSTRLDFPTWIAFIGAMTVECLGLSAVHTSFVLWDYNDAKRQTDQRAPLIVSLLTAGFYLAVVLTVNVLLDPEDPTKRFAKALLSSLSILAAVILAIRSQHARRLDSIDVDKLNRKLERQQKRVENVIGNENGNNGNGGNNGRYRQVAGKKINDWRDLPQEDRVLVRDMTTHEVEQAYSLPERTARHWRALARNNGHKDADENKEG